MTIDATGWSLWRRGSPLALPPPVSEGSVIGVANSGEPVAWPVLHPERAGHLLLLGGSGTGKTTMMASALVDEIAAETDWSKEKRSAHFVIEPMKDDLGSAILSGIAARCPERLSDVIVADPFRQPFPWNLVRLRTKTEPEIRAFQLANLAATLSTASGSQAHLGIGARQADVMMHVCLGVLTASHPAANLTWSVDALMDPKGLTSLGAVTASPRVRQFCGGYLSDELKASCASRLRLAFALTPAVERMFGASACVQFAKLFAPGKIVLLALGSPPGGQKELAAFWASLFTRLAVDHLLERRSPWTGHAVRIVIDEAHLVAGVLADTAEMLLTTGRSRGIALVLATQTPVLFNEASTSLLRVLLTNAPMKTTGRLAAADAEAFVKERAPARGVEETLTATRSRAFARLVNLEDREFVAIEAGRTRAFRTKDVDLEGWAKAAEVHADAIEAARHRAALPEGSPAPVPLSVASPPPERRGRRREAVSASPSVSNAPTRARSRWG